MGKIDVKKIIKQAGDLALNYQKKISVSKKEDSTIVTEGDIAVSDFLIKNLSPLYPVLSEENFDDSLLDTHDTFFLIDPIDGTVSYSKKEETWMIIITLVKNNQALETWIYQPCLDKLFYAKKDKGAFLILKNKQKKLKTSNSLTRLITSPNYKPEDLLLTSHLNPTSHDFEYGAALKISKIAEGLFDLYPIKDRYFGVWDLMGPFLLVQEAGGCAEFENYSFNLKDKKLNKAFVVSSKKIK